MASFMRKYDIRDKYKPVYYALLPLMGEKIFR